MKAVLGVSAIASALAAALVALATPAAATTRDAPPAPLASVVVAGVDDFVFESMDVEYRLGRDEAGASTLDVVETFVAVFPEFDQNRGMRRAIPDTYNGQPLQPRFVSITDGEGHPRPAEVEHEDGEFRMTSRADGYVHGAQVYVFHYTLRNVTWPFADTGDEFYWDVNGLEWRQPFGRVTASVVIDPQLENAMSGQSACYYGGSGSSSQCEIVPTGTDGATALRATAGPLSPGETMTIAIGFATGTFVPFDTSYFASPLGWLHLLAALGLLATCIAAIVIRASKLRDDPGRSVIIAEYAPPKGIDALQAAVFLGYTTKAIPAEVLEQAVVGSIRIVEGERKMFGGYRLCAELVDPSLADGDGVMLLDGLFGPGAPPGARFEFGRTDTRVSAAARQILAWAGKALEEEGMYRHVPRGLRRVPIIVALGFLVATIALGILVAESGRDEFVVVFVGVLSVVLLVATVIVLARRPKSARGAELRDHLLGVRQFISWAEADRIRTLQSPAGAERRPIDPNDPRQLLHLYETLLPYAVVFGFERQWGERLAGMYADGSPGWYSSARGFQAASFAVGIASLSSSASSASSTSGGSSGSGSAGGGGGGGGGGGV